MKNKLMSIFLIVTVLMGIMLTTASALGIQEEIYVGGVMMTEDTYLANGASATTTEEPTDKGYAHLTEGVNGYVLTLHNYEYTGVGHVWSSFGYMIYGLGVSQNLEIVLEGTNKLIATTENAPDYTHGIEIHFKEDYVTHDLSIRAAEGGSLEIDASHIGIRTMEGRVLINGGTLNLNRYISAADSSKVPERSTVVVNGGDITIDTDKSAISASTLDFNNGKLEINGTGSGYTMISSPTISVDDGEILVKSEKCFPTSGTITMAAGISAAASTNVDGTDPVEYDKANYLTYHYLKIAKGAMPEKTDYDVWVNGERFTNTKTTINLADGETASYDYTTNTVTFSDGAAVTEGYCPDTTQSYNPYYGIYSTEGKNLNIIMEGDLSFNLRDNSNTLKIFGGIYVPDRMKCQTKCNKKIVQDPKGIEQNRS